MSDIVRFFPTLAVILLTIWFVSFQLNPYNVCDDHPNKSDYYVCQPIGFELKKGWLERSPDNKFLNEEKSAYVSRKSSKTKKENIKKLEDMCSKKEYRETEEGLINCGE